MYTFIIQIVWHFYDSASDKGSKYTYFYAVNALSGFSLCILVGSLQLRHRFEKLTDYPPGRKPLWSLMGLLREAVGLPTSTTTCKMAVWSQSYGHCGKFYSTSISAIMFVHDKHEHGQPHLRRVSLHSLISAQLKEIQA